MVGRADAVGRVGWCDPEVDVRVGFVFGPGVVYGAAGKVDRKPPSFDIGEMLDDPQQRGGGRHLACRRLLLRQALELPQDRLPVAVEEGAEHRLLSACKGDVEPPMRDNVGRDHRDILGPSLPAAAAGIVDEALEGSSLTAGTPSARCASARGRSESHSRQDLYADFAWTSEGERSNPPRARTAAPS